MKKIRTIKTALANAHVSSIPQYTYYYHNKDSAGRPDNNVFYYLINSEIPTEEWLGSLDVEIGMLTCAYREVNGWEVPEMPFMLEDSYDAIMQILRFTIHGYTRETTIVHLFEAHHRTLHLLLMSNSSMFREEAIKLFSDGANPKRQKLHDLGLLLNYCDVPYKLNAKHFLLWYFGMYDHGVQWRAGEITRKALTVGEIFTHIKETYPKIYMELARFDYLTTLRHVSRVTDGGVSYFKYLHEHVGSLESAITHKENYSPSSIYSWISSNPLMIETAAKILSSTTTDPQSWLDDVYRAELSLETVRARSCWLTPNHVDSNGVQVLTKHQYMTAATATVYLEKAAKEKWDSELFTSLRVARLIGSRGAIYHASAMEMYGDIKACMASNVGLAEVGKLLLATRGNHMLIAELHERFKVSLEQFLELPYDNGTVGHVLARLGYEAKTTSETKNAHGYTAGEISELNRRRRAASNQTVLLDAYKTIGEITVGIQELLEFGKKVNIKSMGFPDAMCQMYLSPLEAAMPKSLQFDDIWEGYSESCASAVSECYELRLTLAGHLAAVGKSDRAEIIKFVKSIYELLNADMIINWDLVYIAHGIKVEGVGK